MLMETTKGNRSHSFLFMLLLIGIYITAYAYANPATLLHLM